MPHRDPFLFIDHVELVDDQKIQASYQINEGHEVFKGHFPGNPVWPGVLQVEGLAQAAGILGMWTSEEITDIPFLAKIEKTRFKQPVLPGSKIVYEVELIKKRHPYYWFEGKALVNGSVVSEVAVSAKMETV